LSDMPPLLVHSSLMVAGFVLLVLGAQWLVKGGSSLALRCGLPPLFIGLTVVAIGTSTPELFVSVSGALQGKGDVSVGNVVGSNIFNIAVILGITALITPIRVSLSVIKLDIPVMIAVSLGAFLLFQIGPLSKISGIVLLTALLLYFITTLYFSKKEMLKTTVTQAEEDNAIPTMAPICSLILIGVGGVLLVFGADLVVDNATSIAETLGIHQAVISLTIVGMGTSLPELVTSVIAALKRQPDMAIGNVVGSNIFNILGVLGASSLVTPLSAPGLTLVDWVVMIFFSVLLLPLAWTGTILDRREGAFFLTCYLIYFCWLWKGSFS
jgi:cation:H+ antiporter